MKKKIALMIEKLEFVIKIAMNYERKPPASDEFGVEMKRMECVLCVWEIAGGITETRSWAFLAALYSKKPTSSHK